MPPKRVSKRTAPAQEIPAQNIGQPQYLGPITIAEYLIDNEMESKCPNPNCTACRPTQTSVQKRDLSPLPHYVSKSKFSKHLFCPVCMEVLNHPIRLFCGHVYCAPCIKQIWGKAIQIGTSCCPLDRVDIKWELVHFDLVIKNLLAAQQVYCTNRKNSCPWEGLKRDQGEHMDKCVYKELPEWLKAIKDNSRENKGNEDNYMEDEELAEIIEREVPDVDLMTRMYFKDQNLVKNVLGKKLKDKDSVKEPLSEQKRKTRNSKKSTDQSQKNPPVRLSTIMNEFMKVLDEHNDLFDM